MSSERILLIGFDESETAALTERLSVPCVSHEMLPKIVVKRGKLFVESPERVGYLRVSRVVFHGIFEHDLEFLAGLALWGGPCFPNPTGMMDCRLRLQCLVHALRFTKYGGQRGYASTDGDYDSESESVAKWGNWHCGENKERFTGMWSAKEPTLFEPFVAGEAVRVIILGKEARQIRLTGKDWRKSVHGSGAEFMTADPELVADTQAIRMGLGLDIIANDYMVSESGPYLLEVNHIPSVTCFPELWQEYIEVVAAWAGKHAVSECGSVQRHQRSAAEPGVAPRPNHQCETFGSGQTQFFECDALPADHPEIQARERARQQRLQPSDPTETYPRPGGN